MPCSVPVPATVVGVASCSTAAPIAREHVDEGKVALPAGGAQPVDADAASAHRRGSEEVRRRRRVRLDRRTCAPR